MGSRHWTGGRGGALLLLAWVLPVAACGDPLAPDPAVPLPPDVRPWVTGAAAAALDADGRFLLPDPVAPGPEPIIDREFAGDLALAFIRTWVANPNVVVILGGESIRESLESGHGGPVDWGSVHLDPRLAYFAETPYEPLPDSVHTGIRRHFGPKYLAPVFERGQQVASISVAAYSTDLRIDERGFVDLPPVYGSEFIPTGIPGGLPFRVPLWPEEAVRFAAEATGARVAEIPTLVLPRSDTFPQAARWRLTLDRDVEVRTLTTGSRERTRTVYLGIWYRPLRVVWYLAADEQPVSQTVRYPAREDGERVVREIEVGIREDLPLRFVEVEPVG